MPLDDIIKKRKRQRALKDNPNLEVLEKIENIKLTQEKSLINLVEESVKRFVNDLWEVLKSKLISDTDKIIKEKVDNLTKNVKKRDKGDTIKGDKGEDYILTKEDRQEIASKIKVPIVKKIVEKTETIVEKPIITNEIKEVAITDKPEMIASKLNTLEEKVELSVIKGLL